ncbi:MAG: hypothetical protein ACLR23_19425 [Clostridia bacterium]
MDNIFHILEEKRRSSEMAILDSELAAALSLSKEDLENTESLQEGYIGRRTIDGRSSFGITATFNAEAGKSSLGVHPRKSF